MPSTGTLGGEDGGSAAGASPSITEAGPPERMMPLGSNCFASRVDRLEGMDLAVDPGFAHAPGDQLGDLGTEIEDQQTVGHGAIYGTRGPVQPASVWMSLPI